jgi:hypothetical protein
MSTVAIIGAGLIDSSWEQHTDPPHSLGLLRASAERPCECDAKIRD